MFRGIAWQTSTTLYPRPWGRSATETIPAFRYHQQTTVEPERMSSRRAVCKPWLAVRIAGTPRLLLMSVGSPVRMSHRRNKAPHLRKYDVRSRYSRGWCHTWKMYATLINMITNDKVVILEPYARGSLLSPREK